jgi:hypothetical protein
MKPIDFLEAVKKDIPQLKKFVLDCESNPALEKMAVAMFPKIAPFMDQVKAILPYVEHIDALIPYVDFLEQLLIVAHIA